MLWPDGRMGHRGLCPACVQMFWCNPSDSGETISCPHCGQMLRWHRRKFHLVEFGSQLSELGLVRPFMSNFSGPLESDCTDIDLTTWIIPDDVLQLIPEELAIELCVIPLALEADGAILVAIADALDFFALDKLRFVVNREVRCVVKAQDAIVEALKRTYRRDV